MLENKVNRHSSSFVMESRGRIKSAYNEGGLEASPSPLNGEPNYLQSSQLPFSSENERPSRDNGVERTTSRRRRSAGIVIPSRIPVESFPQPPAPEVPKAPPVSYRPPYEAGKNAFTSTGYPSPSFAERARALTGNTIPILPYEPSPEPSPQPAKPVRRGSLNRPIGGLYSEIQQHKRDSYPPPNGPISPRRFSNPTNIQQDQVPDSASYGRISKPTVDHELPKRSLSTTSKTQTSSRRASAGFSQSSKKEWAPERSPLQKLEVKLSDISKEEKRARVQEAEQRLKDSQVGATQRRSVREGGSVMDSNTVKRDSATMNERRPEGPRQNPDSSRLERQTRLPTDAERSHPTAPASTGKTSIARPDKQRDLPPIHSYSRREGETGHPAYGRPTTHDRSHRDNVKVVGMSQPQQNERGVRFEGQDDVENLGTHTSEPDTMDRQNHRKSSVTKALAKSDVRRNSPRSESRQESQNTDNEFSSRQIPKTEHELYKIRADETQNSASAATYGGVPDPVPRHAVRAHGHGSKYEIPPQSAAGIRARQALGMDNGLQGAANPPAHRKHHFSDILHQGHNHAPTLDEHSGRTNKRLDEWRRAGTARLTAADFGPQTDSGKDQGAWWEGGRSGSQRKGGRMSNKEAPSLQGGYQASTGKFKSPFTHRRGQDRVQEVVPLKTSGYLTRPYLGEDEFEQLERESEKHVSHFLHRLGHDRISGLSSAYSYSCPNLAIHNPSHEDHLCEPYLSKELIQSMRSIRIRTAPEVATFNPPLYLKCGPLLRYTGLKRDRLQMQTRSGAPSSIERETWRGSVMIVTADADSDYDPAPTLRLFPEPMDILPAPAQTAGSDNVQDLPPEYVDPIAGLPKLSRSGKTVYVKPVDDLEHSKDLSRLENDDGLFEETRTAAVPTAYGTPDFRASTANPKPVRREERASKRGQLVKGARLHAERGVTFWRFNLEVELGSEQARIAYSINRSPSVGFWVPARGHSMNVMFHSCNGFSMSVK